MADPYLSQEIQQFQKFIQANLPTLCASKPDQATPDYIKLLDTLKRVGVITAKEHDSIVNTRGLKARTEKLYTFASTQPAKLQDLIKILRHHSFTDQAELLSKFTPDRPFVPQQTTIITLPVTTVITPTSSNFTPRGFTETVTQQISSTVSRVHENVAATVTTLIEPLSKLTTTDDKPPPPPPSLKSKILKKIPREERQRADQGRRNRTDTFRNDARPFEGGPQSPPTTYNGIGSNDDDDEEDNIDEKVANLLNTYVPQRYPSSPGPCKGLALLINIVTFDDDEGLYREGAHKDADNLYEVLDTFGYDVYDVLDVSAKDLKQAIRDFKQLIEEKQANSCIVAVMSHGFDENNILARDRQLVSCWNDLIEKFNNDNCPQLKGKPKIFLFQYCRGRETDRGIAKPKTQTDSIRIPTIPTWTDILVCHSTLHGYYAYRDTESGSWFIQSLCDVLRKYSRVYDICKMLNLVSEIMKLREGEDGEKQICPFYNIGFTKEFYFESQ